jgi:DNA recombination protein RmuC
MFLPGETFYSVALEQMPGLIEEGFSQNVLIATPTTLLGLLRAVSAGWREERVAENAQRISEEGRRLHERIATLAEKLSDLGRSLGQAVGAYNGTIATFDTRVMPSARNLAALDAKGKKDLPELEMIDRRPAPPRKLERLRPTPLTLSLSPSPSPSPPSPPTQAALEGEG